MKKIIWIHWDAGWENAPDICKACMKSWYYNNPTWEINLLDSISIKKYTNIPKIDNITKTAETGIIKRLILYKYGGVFVDATLLCSCSLDKWLPKCVKNGFFVFLNKNNIISTWFIASEPKNYLMGLWSEEIIKFTQDKDYKCATLPKQGSYGLWKNGHKYPSYFANHYIFSDLVSTDLKCKNIFRNMPKITIDQNNGFGHINMNTTEEISKVLKGRKLTKLTYKFDLFKVKKDVNSFIGNICKFFN